MNKIKGSIKLFFALIIFSNTLASDHPDRILFVGNSYLYYNDSMHNHVEKMLIEHYGDNEIATKSATIGGSKLHNHNIDHLLDFKNLQLKGPIDLLIMQGASTEVKTQKSREKFSKTAVEFSNKAQKLGIKTALYMTHAYLENDKRYEPNLIDKIKKNYYEAASKSNSLVIPVGLAYKIAYEEDPKIKLHHPDGTHPGLLGTYLGASTVFAIITNSSPAGLSYNYYDSVSDKDRKFLQEIAWKAYLQNKEYFDKYSS
tara:strand:+ start:2540 stop:3310 length:771 start_codon:yes stop_codon:yes gene_type:complete